MVESSPKVEKTLCKKEKLLILSNFSSSHSVFKRLSLQTRKNKGLFEKELIIPFKSMFFENHCSLVFPTMSANLLQQILKFESHLFVVCKCF